MLQDYVEYVKAINNKIERLNDIGSYPPLSQIPQGSWFAGVLGTVKEPLVFSTPMKKSVSLGWPGRCTGILPAYNFPKSNVTLGSFLVTSKSKR